MGKGSSSDQVAIVEVAPLRLYCSQCDSSFHTKVSLEESKRQTLEKYPICSFNTRSSDIHPDDFIPDSGEICDVLLKV